MICRMILFIWLYSNIFGNSQIGVEITRPSVHLYISLVEKSIISSSGVILYYEKRIEDYEIIRTS